MEFLATFLLSSSIYSYIFKDVGREVGMVFHVFHLRQCTKKFVKYTAGIRQMSTERTEDCKYGEKSNNDKDFHHKNKTSMYFQDTSLIYG